MKKNCSLIWAKAKTDLRIGLGQFGLTFNQINLIVFGSRFSPNKTKPNPYYYLFFNNQQEHITLLLNQCKPWLKQNAELNPQRVDKY